MSQVKANGMTAEQRKLFEAMLKAKGVKASTNTIAPYRDAEPVRLSHQQEGMWFLEQMNPGHAIYNLPCCVRIRGNLDTSAMSRALIAIVNRHDALRTRFVMSNNAPVLAVDEPGKFNVAQIDFSSLSANEAEQQAKQFIDKETRKPFDLANDSVIRASLAKISTQDYILVMVLHHIVTDGWSMGIFMRELTKLYEALAKDSAIDLPALPIRFVDYAAWLRTWLAENNQRKLIDFWKEQLTGVVDLKMPHDRARQANNQNSGSHTAVELTREQTLQVAVFSKAARVTRFTTLLAAFRAAVFSFSGQTDQVIGSPFSCRNRRELENIIGYFVNVLPLRCDLSGDPTFSELVQRSRKVDEAVHEHQDMPYAKIVQDLDLSRRDGANPVYQVQFTLLDPNHIPDLLDYGLNVATSEKHLVGDVRLSSMPIDNAVSKFDLVLLLWDKPDKIIGSCEFDTSLFDPTTIEEIWRRFATIVATATSTPEMRLSTLVAPYQQPTKPEDKTMDAATTDKKPADIRITRRKRQRQTVSSNSRDWVSARPLFADQKIPLLIEPAIPGVDLSEWAKLERAYVDELLMQHRALLFRGFKNVDVATFERFVMATSNGQLLEYKDRTTPRETKGNRVYTSTVHPADERINPHNEGTYWIRWPLRLFFCCQIAAEVGGETPIADVRRVYNRLSNATREKFAAKKMMLVRNFNDGFGMPWQEVFQSDNPEEVEAYCRANKIEWEWKSNGRLRTRQVRDAIRQHPETGENVWFNHAAFFHYTTLEENLRNSLINELGMDGLPYSTFYGDGSEIEPEVAQELRDAYAAETVKFLWEEGDIMLLDNMSVSHAREPFKGKRDVVVCMTDVYDGQATQAMVQAGG